LTVCDLASGVSNIDNNNEFLFYPNPVSNTLTIQNASNCHYKLLDSGGRMVSSGRIDGVDWNLDLRSYAAGIYQLLLSADNKTTCSKLVVFR